MSDAPNCCLCGQRCEPWYPGWPGYGHNPAPLGDGPDDRCCDTCNFTKVVPARFAEMRRRRQRR